MTASASEPSQPGFRELGPALHVLPRDRGASTSLSGQLLALHSRGGTTGPALRIWKVSFCRMDGVDDEDGGEGEGQSEGDKHDDEHGGGDDDDMKLMVMVVVTGLDDDISDAS